MNRKTDMMLEIENRYGGKDIADILVELYHELGTQTAVAKELGVDISVLNRWAWRLGLSFERRLVVRELA